MCASERETTKCTESKRKLERETIAIVKGHVALIFRYVFMFPFPFVFGFVLVACQLFHKQIDLNAMCRSRCAPAQKRRGKEKGRDTDT